MAKWNSLTYFLNGVSNEITLTWPKLDEIVGGMPASAAKYRFKNGLVEVNLNHTQRFTADFDSESWVNMKGSESTAERIGINSLLKEMNQNMNVADRLESEGFAYVGPIVIERDSSGHPAEYLPQNRYVNLNRHPLNRHGKGPFCRFDIPKLPEASGVYAITVDNFEDYIGECQNFRERYGPRGYGVIHPRNCFDGGQPTNCKINARVLEATLSDAIPDLWFAPEVAETRKRVEAELIARYLPPWNGRC